MGLLIGESFAAGVLEALQLVVVVSSALAVADGGRTAEIGLRVFGGARISTGLALGIGALAGVTVLLIHAHIASLTARLAGNVLAASRDRATVAFARASWARQSDEREGSLQETISTLSLQTAILVTHFSVLGASMIALLALLFASLIVDPASTLVVVIVGAGLFAMLRPLARATRRRARAFVAANSSFSERITQWTRLAMDLRVFGVEDAELERLGAENRATARAFQRSRFMSRLGVEVYRDIAVLLLVLSVALVASRGTVDVGSVGAVVLLMLRSLSAVQKINGAVQQINENGPNLDSLIDRLISLEASGLRDGSEPLGRLGRVECRGVSYVYGDGRAGLTDVTFDIEPGELIGIIGPSGGGKSTLVQVLLRLRTPTEGCVRVSGLPYEEIEPQDWRRLVALVPQEPQLFQGSVAENIRFFRRDISAGAIETAAKAAHVFEDVQDLPAGFDTELGPRGAGLSGGQKQRIVIARALAADPEMLVLDEPTSALDVRSEQLFRATIDRLRGDVTLLIVAHRMTTLLACDRVIAMDSGEVRVIGSLAEAQAVVAFDFDDDGALIVPAIQKNPSKKGKSM